MLALGLIAYGAVFALVGTRLKRPLIIGLVVRVRLGAGRPAVSGLPQAANGRILSAGARETRDAVRTQRRACCFSCSTRCRRCRPASSVWRVIVGLALWWRGPSGRETGVCPGTIRAYVPYKRVRAPYMTSKTRYFVIASLLVIGVGLGTGLVAYYVGFPAGAFAGTRRPGGARLCAARRGRHRLRRRPRRHDVGVAPAAPQRAADAGKRTARARREDRHQHRIRHRPHRRLPLPGTRRAPITAGMVLARGRFDEGKIEALMREHGGHVEELQRPSALIVADESARAVRAVCAGLRGTGLCRSGQRRCRPHLDRSASSGQQPAGRHRKRHRQRRADEPCAFARNRQRVGGRPVRRPDLAGRTSRTTVANQIPAITWFSVSAHINGGVRGVLRADTRDDEAANNLRDVVRGFLALGSCRPARDPKSRR